MKELVFATNNAHKLEELRRIAGEGFRILSLSDIGCHDDIPEDADTIAGNALAKARWVANRYRCACFADDTGLEVDAVGGAPGVHTARYAGGDGHDSQANMALLLKNLAGIPAGERTARFRTVIALIDENGAEHCFHGICEGSILTQKQGEAGFGYDPVFLPQGCDRSFAQLSPDEKNAISHRGRAARQFLAFINSDK